MALNFLLNLALLFLPLSPLFSSATPSISSPFNISPKTQAQKLIRELNLFPKSDINIGSSMKGVFSNSSAPLMVERPLNLLVEGESGATVKELGHHAGFYRLPHTKDARMFYFFFESRKNKNDPVVIWLTGGPGCSSELALFYENGPFKLSNNLSLVWNDYGWDQASNLIYVDQPTGTGFSYSSDEDDIRHDEDGVSNDLYDFLQEFFKNHPMHANNDFYITGESYAGHYIPAFAARVHKGNKAKEGIHINLKGFAIGNGLTNPAIQYRAYPDYALDMKLINQSIHNEISKLVPPCEKAIERCGSEGGTSCVDAYYTCISIFQEILSYINNTSYYDIRMKCERHLCYDFSNLEVFLNKKSVRDALGVGDTEFVSCSSEVYYAMVGDWMKNLEVVIPPMLEDGIRMVAYAGEYDLICNWLGNSRWVHAMEWSGQKSFTDAQIVPFVVNGEEKGQLKNYGPLVFLKVYDAGHMVPMDQPKAALEFLKRWTQSKLTRSRHGTFAHT